MTISLSVRQRVVRIGRYSPAFDADPIRRRLNHRWTPDAPSAGGSPTIGSHASSVACAMRFLSGAPARSIDNGSGADAAQPAGSVPVALPCDRTATTGPAALGSQDADPGRALKPGHADRRGDPDGTYRFLDRRDCRRTRRSRLRAGLRAGRGRGVSGVGRAGARNRDDRRSRRAGAERGAGILAADPRDDGGGCRRGRVFLLVRPSLQGPSGGDLAIAQEAGVDPEGRGVLCSARRQGHSDRPLHSGGARRGAACRRHSRHAGDPLLPRQHHLGDRMGAGARHDGRVDRRLARCPRGVRRPPRRARFCALRCRRAGGVGDAAPRAAAGQARRAYGQAVARLGLRGDGWGQRQVRSLFEPGVTEIRGLLLLGALLVGGFWLFFGVLQDVVAGDPLVRADRAVLHFFEALRADWVDRAAAALVALGTASVILAVAAAMLLWLLWRRAWRAALYELGAIAGTAAFAIGMQVALPGGALAPTPPAVPGSWPGAGLPPAWQMAEVTALFTFLAVLVVREGNARHAVVVPLAVALLLVLLGFARLYLGIDWLSTILAAAAFGVAWVAFLGLLL